MSDSVISQGNPNPVEPAIRFEGVSVRYRVPREKVSGIKEFAIRWLQRRIVYQDFWALRNISFQIQPGEIFGVIGRNGAGKSTLLKVMARVLKPVEGRVVMRGSVAPLLELGGGFHPELTGRENVFLNMALLGRSRKQTAALFDSIITFAEIGNFIEAPLRTYSTGMVSRLGFAVATCLRPDILLVDEVLSVGDSWFQEKCLERMYSFQRQGTTIVIVSHSMAAIETFCKRAVWLEGGRLQVVGPADQVIEQYRQAAPAISPGQQDEIGVSPPAVKYTARDGLGTTPVLAPGMEQSQPMLAPRPVASELGSLQAEYVTFDQIGGIYSAQDIFDVSQGSVAVELKFSKPLADAPGKVAALFHTDDSRYVLSVTTEHVHPEDEEMRKIVARAGGNHRAFDPFYGTSDFPEASAVVLNTNQPASLANRTGTPQSFSGVVVQRVDLELGAWHPLVMTWSGYPQGLVRLYIDGKLIGEKTYDQRHDRGDHLPTQISIGMRPPEWRGEMLRKEDGTLLDLRPQSSLSVEEAGLDIRDVRLYRRTLSEGEIKLSLGGVGPVKNTAAVKNTARPQQPGLA